MRSLLIAGVLLFTLLTFYSALWFKSENIEADITKRVTEDLTEANAKDIEIDVDGRHVTLSGVVYDTATEDAYLDTANDTYGALGPIDGLTMRDGGGFLKAVKSADGITLTGTVPSEDARTALLEAATTGTDGNVTDAMTVGAAEGAWTDEAGLGLAQMAALSSGALSVTPDSYTLSGTTNGDVAAVNAPLADRAGWQSFVSAPTVQSDLTAQLGTLNADVSDLKGQVETLTGDVAARDETISGLTSERDTLTTSLAAMTLSRDTALDQGDATTADVIAERDALAAQLDSVNATRGVLSETVTGLSGERDTLKQSIAAVTSERDTALTDLDNLRASLDDTQSSTSTLRGELSDAQAQVAERDATIEGLNGEVADLTDQLATQTTSMNAGQQEDAALRAQIAEQTGTIDTLTADVAARDTTIAGLEGDLSTANGALETANAQVDTLTADIASRDTTIAGLEGDLAGANEAKTAAMAQVDDLTAQAGAAAGTAAQVATLTGQVASLQAKGDEMSAEVGTLTAMVEERDATIADLQAAASAAPAATTTSANTGAASQIAAQCGARAGEILQNAQINFSSGTANIRSTSVETLERLTGIALACADSGLAVEIGGHTDSQGSDTSNQSLSERRAQAVAQFMTDRGVPADTLNPKGFGEAQPIGDNETREGRQANRRISFEWQAR